MLQRLHIRLLLLILVSVLPAFGIIVHTALEQRNQALTSAEQQAISVARSIAQRRQGLIRHPLDFATSAFADEGRSKATAPATWLEDVLATENLPKGSVLTLVDARGTILARVPDPEGLVGRPVPDLEFFRNLAASGGRATIESQWLDGIRRVTHMAPLDDADKSRVYVRVGIPTDVVVGGVDDILRRNLVLFAAAMLAVLVFGWLASDHLVLRRVRDLAETARRFGAGDLSARPRVPPDEGELGELARAFGEMAEGLEKRQCYIEYLATRDGLTDLPNRNLLLDRAGQAISYAGRNGRWVAMAVIDIDRLKMVNDSLGHRQGDALLIAAAERLRAAVREEDTVARLEGDEFVLLFADLERPDLAVTIVPKAADTLLQPFQMEGRELHVTASIGIALYPDDGESAEVLIRNAQSAMHRLKAEGGNGLQFYTPQMSADATERLHLEQALRRALEREEFTLHYQPKVDLRTGRIGSIEALIRWQHPELGMVSPARFIPVAEEMGLIVNIGEWVLRTACGQLKRWQDAGLPPLSVAVNLSPKQFGQGDITGLVTAVLAETGIEASFLDLEVTEGTIMRDLEKTISDLSSLRRLGVAVSIDDFGTGYSSLGYLRRLPLDKLKIDRSFVRDLTQDGSAALLIKQIIAIAHSLGLTVIAEGVETEAELEFLKENGCDEVQGFYFSPPLPAGDFEALMQSGGVLPRAQMGQDWEKWAPSI